MKINLSSCREDILTNLTLQKRKYSQDFYNCFKHKGYELLSPIVPTPVQNWLIEDNHIGNLQDDHRPVQFAEPALSYDINDI